jgi:SAM-dependent methyltransferase
MAEQAIRFDDGAAYERLMGVWSQLAGNVFLDWLAPPSGLRWIDVGCGNGAFTALIASRCAPAEIQGVDPSDGQLAYARTRPDLPHAAFRQGDAMALPFDADRFDAAVMALVLVLVSDPAKGVAEMVRVVRPGGLVASYTWDMLGGGFPLDPIHDELRGLGLVPPRASRSEASGLAELVALWMAAGPKAVETQVITVQRSFDDFEDFWTTNVTASSLSPVIATMASADVQRLKSGVRTRLRAGAQGPITYGSRAHAIRGRVPL